MQAYKHVLYVVLERTKGKLGWWKFPSLPIRSWPISYSLDRELSVLCIVCIAITSVNIRKNNHFEGPKLRREPVPPTFPNSTGWNVQKFTRDHGCQEMYNNSADRNVARIPRQWPFSRFDRHANCFVGFLERERDKKEEKKRDGESISNSDCLSSSPVS